MRSAATWPTLRDSLPFQFSITQAYILEFGDLYMRVFKDSGAVTLADKTIDDTTAATPVSVGVTAHGLSTGDEVFIAGTGVVEITTGMIPMIVAVQQVFHRLVRHLRDSL